MANHQPVNFFDIMKLIRAILLLLLFLLNAGWVFATSQYLDLLIVGDTTFELCNFPLEVYLEHKGNRIIGQHKLEVKETALYRGYIATWELKNDSLFLVHLKDGQDKDAKEISLFDEFGSNRIFSYWVTDMLRCLQGEVLQYDEFDRYSSIYEGEGYYAIEKGKLKGATQLNYLERDENRLFPGEDFLCTYLSKKIRHAINKAEREKLDEDSPCDELHIHFDKEGKISFIGYFNRKSREAKEREPENVNEEIILRNARKALKKIPPLMNITHKWYSPHRFSLYFSIHCLKHPEDKEYGCDEE